MTELRRYPVKSMLGEVIDHARMTERGVEGDRAYGLFDPETNKVVSVKRPARWGRLFEFTATTEQDGVWIAFPDGQRWRADDGDLPQHLSEFFGRPVQIVSVPIEGRAIFDETWEGELKAYAKPPPGMTIRHEDGIETVDGGGSYGVPGGLFNFGAVHLVTTSTVRALSAARPETRFDAYRFRPNVVVDTPADGFIETDWQDRTLTVGEVRLKAQFTVPRCVMTVQPQGDLPADREVLRTITQLNQVELLGEKYPCVGIYAETLDEGGTVRVGDPVMLD
ncbi:MAG TPA: MOSC domain-containing protein [Acidimicrobiales bacterium]|nr:MOSC domain-containing protein [Acidimicrobiales bacterium]